MAAGILSGDTLTQTNCETNYPKEGCADACNADIFCEWKETDEEEGRCGPDYGHVTCEKNEFCSQYGWCGTADGYKCGLTDYDGEMTDTGKCVATDWLSWDTTTNNNCKINYPNIGCADACDTDLFCKWKSS